MSDKETTQGTGLFGGSPEQPKQQQAWGEKEATQGPGLFSSPPKQEQQEKATEGKEKPQEQQHQQGGGWMNQSIGSTLGEVAKDMAGGKELTGKNSLSSSLAAAIERGQAKAQEKLAQEKEQAKERER